MTESEGAASLTICRPNSAPRQKRWAPKVKTGCITCRFVVNPICVYENISLWLFILLYYSCRRIKCDEAKPACRRCISTGRLCEGYISNTALRTAESSRQDEPSRALITFYIEASTRQRKLFHWFHNEAVHQISGTLDSAFWNVRLPQVGHHCQPIWHVAVALSAVHVQWKMQQDTEASRLARKEYYADGLENYSIALRHLSRIAGKPHLNHSDREVLLICSILFGCICTFLEDGKQALVHLFQSCRLFKQWKQLDRLVMNETPVDNPQLSLMFRYFENEYLHAGRHKLEHQQLQQDLTNAAMVNSVTRDMGALHEQILSLWDGKEWTSQKIPQQISNPGCTFVIQLWTVGAEIELHFDFGGIDLDLAWFKSSLLELIHLAQQLLDKSHFTKGGKLVSLVIAFTSLTTFEVVCIPGHHCDCRTKSRSAFCHLTRWPIQQGFWDSTVLTTMSGTGAISSSGGVLWYDSTRDKKCNCRIGTLICNNHRIEDTPVTFIRDGGAKLIMKMVSEVATNRPVHVITLLW